MYPHLLTLFTLFYLCAAQLGAEIFKPESNDTISPGEKVNTQFQYNNMGVGQYTLDVNLWKDNGLNDLAYAVAHGIPLPSGNSTGTHVDFYMNSTYSWTVPHGLNETVYLTVHTNITSSTSNLTLRSAPIMLHVNSALSLIPSNLLLVFILVLFFLK
ncbi:hypothetical protein G6F56_005753 [Rhizopus delemar]|uniref:Uncharacterized protein n=1 Tax=Rhizopus stolonifer TaxID=4846 RepID=A0A367KLR1_RHIST|nr:hypothetical protein G6F56_005753 [Rhizopus delemar]RCI03099.1 hypothetical protein CU098_010376 [Rhizopus stolonifer]